MATIHRISEELFVDSFDLIALHTHMECFTLAYHINKVAQVLLVRAKKDLEIGPFSYSMFEYKDDVKHEDWYLINNLVYEEIYDQSGGLFQNSTTLKMNYLLEERKEINYLLKIYPEDAVDITKTVEAIRSIPRVEMVYQISVEDLKSKRNLIF